MDTYIITHTHRHGVDTFLVHADFFPEIEEVVSSLGIDFEPDRGEDIVIDTLIEGDIPTLIRSAEGAVSVEGAQEEGASGLAKPDAIQQVG